MHAMTGVRLLVAGLSAWATVSHALAQTVPLERTRMGHFVAPVRIDGEGPFPFAPDTGASHTAVAQPLAEAFGFVGDINPLTPVQTLTEEIEAERHVLLDLSLGLVSATALDVVVTPIAADVELDLYGLLGSDFFAGHVVRLDYPASELVVDAPAPDHVDARLDPTRRVLIGAAEARHLGGPIQVLVDTGSPVTLVNPALARSLNRRRPVTISMVSSVSRLPDPVETEDRVILSRFKLGGLCLRQIGVDSADLDVFRAMGWENTPAMIVGLDLLQNTALTIDYDTGATQIEPARPVWRCPDSRRSQVSP